MEEHKGTIESRALTAAALVRCHIKPASLIHQKSGETPGAGLMGDPFFADEVKQKTLRDLKTLAISTDNLSFSSPTSCFRRYLA
jgi:hypothetical protein